MSCSSEIQSIKIKSLRQQRSYYHVCLPDFNAYSVQPSALACTQYATIREVRSYFQHLGNVQVCLTVIHINIEIPRAEDVFPQFCGVWRRNDGERKVKGFPPLKQRKEMKSPWSSNSKVFPCRLRVVPCLSADSAIKCRNISQMIRALSIVWGEWWHRNALGASNSTSLPMTKGWFMWADSAHPHTTSLDVLTWFRSKSTR